jgi:hypothetical protein
MMDEEKTSEGIRGYKADGSEWLRWDTSRDKVKDDALD